MSGTIVCERHWSRADYDKDLMLRARRSMEILNRAPEDTDSPYPTEGEVRMDRIECYDFLKRAIVAVDFFCSVVFPRAHFDLVCQRVQEAIDRKRK